MSRFIHKENFFIQDLSIIFLSVLLAFVVTKTNLLSSLIISTTEMKLLGSFIAGIFFTSIFTTAPAIVALGQLANSGSILQTALFGSVGSVIGDLVIFVFIKDRLSEHLVIIIKHENWWKKLHSLFKLRYFRWITFLVGGIILASPLPDELGIGLLGFSKMRVKAFIPLSFFFNFIGILIVGILARSI